MLTLTQLRALHRGRKPGEILVHWIRKREQVREAKEAGEFHPWTDDPIIASYRFCNVDREDDKVTEWIEHHIRRPYANHPALLFNLVLARYINWIPALTRAGPVERWDARTIRAWAARLRDGDGQVFGGAYIIPVGKERAPSKLDWLIEHTFTPMWRGLTANGARSDWWASCQQMYNWLTQFKGCGPFMANQIVTDAKYTPLLNTAHDRATFVACGPGTLRGIARMQNDGRIGLIGDDPEGFLRDLRAYLVSTGPRLPPRIVRALRYDLNNLSNCMCEFDKYMRTLRGEGKPKTRYTP